MHSPSTSGSAVIRSRRACSTAPPKAVSDFREYAEHNSRPGALSPTNSPIQTVAPIGGIVRLAQDESRSPSVNPSAPTYEPRIFTHLNPADFATPSAQISRFGRARRYKAPTRRASSPGPEPRWLHEGHHLLRQRSLVGYHEMSRRQSPARSPTSCAKPAPAAGG